MRCDLARLGSVWLGFEAKRRLSMDLINMKILFFIETAQNKLWRRQRSCSLIWKRFASRRYHLLNQRLIRNEFNRISYLNSIANEGYRSDRRCANWFWVECNIDNDCYENTIKIYDNRIYMGPFAGDNCVRRKSWKSIRCSVYAVSLFHFVIYLLHSRLPSHLTCSKLKSNRLSCHIVLYTNGNAINVINFLYIFQWFSH